MAIICREVVERIEETVWEPVEEWVERREKKCKKRKCKKLCLCCNKWFCWIETFLEKVVTWAVKHVVKVVVRSVCEIVSDVLKAVWDTLVVAANLVADVLRMVWNLITFDWQDFKDAWKDFLSHLADIGPLIVKWLRIAVAVGTFGLPYLLGYIYEEIQMYRLKMYVRKKLEARFGEDPDRLRTIKDAINLDHGPFGLEFDAVSIRTYVDSRTAPPEGGSPTLLSLHEAGAIDLYELTGLNVGNILDRPRVDAYLVDGELPLGNEDVDAYISSGGAGPHFQVIAFNGSAENQKLNVARDKGRQVGLKLQWDQSAPRKEVTGSEQMNIDKTQLRDFLLSVLERASDGNDVCRLAAAGVFNITDPSDGRHPFGWTKWYSVSNPLSGLIHRDRLPAEFMKYVLIHECGHYFSLEHEGHDGLDKIMWSPTANGWWSWNLILEFLVWSGEPRFTLADGKRVWDFLVDTITGCLPGASPVIL